MNNEFKPFPLQELWTCFWCENEYTENEEPVHIDYGIYTTDNPKLQCDKCAKVTLEGLINE